MDALLNNQVLVITSVLPHATLIRSKRNSLSPFSKHPRQPMMKPLLSLKMRSKLMVKMKMPLLRQKLKKSPFEIC